MPDPVALLQRQIADLASLAEADFELEDAYRAMMAERRAALERMLRRDDDAAR